MREILFRGQTRKKGEKVSLDGTPVESNWVYGGIFQGPNRSVIYGYEPIEKHVVYSETVGQFTGLTDKNGKKIFEGDIAIYDDDLVVIEWHDEDAMFFTISQDGTNWTTNFSMISGKELEVIGNIHDNPELLND